MTGIRCWRWWLAGLVVLLLSACGGLPTSSNVVAQQPISSAPGGDGPQVELPGPQPGASPVEVIKQFLRANGSLNDDFSVARQFLTTSADKQWRPGQTVSVNNGERDFSVTPVSGDTVRVVATEWAVLDAGSHLNELAAPRTRTADFKLRRNSAGEWRISQLPSSFGIWLSVTDFNRLYTPRTVYYAERSTHTLVPDRQWFPQTGLATSLARAVLAGPPAWMTAGVAGTKPQLNILPSGAGLAVDAVPIDDATGITTVDLNQQVLKADPSTRTALWASMMETLDQVDSVRQVVLRVGGTRLETPALPASPVRAADVGYQIRPAVSSNVLLRSGNSLRWADAAAGDSGKSGSGAAPPSLPGPSRNWYLLAADSTATHLAAVSGDRTSITRWDNGVRASDQPPLGQSLVRPSFDALGELWIAGDVSGDSGPDLNTGTSAVVWVVDTTAPAGRQVTLAVQAPWLKSSHVLAFRVAPDAQRAALVVRDAGGGTRLLLTMIVRDSTGTPTGLSNPLDLTRGLTQLASVTWQDDTSLAVIGRRPVDQTAGPLELPISGFMTPLGTAAGGTEILGTGAGSDDLYLLTNQPAVLSRQGSGWQRIDADDVVIPGK